MDARCHAPGAAVDLNDPVVMQALIHLANMSQAPLCPSCGRRDQNPRSKNGWCRECDAVRERELESKRRWWQEHGRQRARRREPQRKETKDG